MKVKVTKVMANELNKQAKERNVPYSFHYEELEEQHYKMSVCFDLFTAEDYGDYNWQNGKMKAIRVVYPSEYYAMDNWLTTQILRKLFVNGDTIETYMDKVFEYVEI